ncbi:MAG: M20 family metallo-hydrolase [Gammaproteobacteria bacterium]|nr:M20 family metallo-hydrolase [Gammaproteobacteria bacterium]
MQPAAPDRDALGDEIMRRIERIAQCSEPGPGVTRLPFTAQHRRAAALLRRWMEAAGLTAHTDHAGTLVGRRDGDGDGGRGALLLGSHQDSIPQGGRYDGMLGIVLPIVCLEYLKHAPLAFAVEVLAFADEEGVRFPTAMPGPRALAGTFDAAALDLRDRDGVSLRRAMREYGARPDDIAQLARAPDQVLGFVETHIEQGPVLQHRDLPLGVVTAICGIERWSVSLRGRAAHAGTTPVELRRDALACAAEVVAEVERYCRATDELTGNVGALSVTPNAVNVVPSRVELSLELRAGDDRTRRLAAAEVTGRIRRIAENRGIEAALQQTYAQAAVQCDAALSDALQTAVTAAGCPAHRLVSGATHDASAMAAAFPVAMLFVRCRDGVSHHPAESMTAADAGAAAAALIAFLTRFGGR